MRCGAENGDKKKIIMRIRRIWKWRDGWKFVILNHFQISKIESIVVLIVIMMGENGDKKRIIKDEKMERWMEK